MTSVIRRIGEPVKIAEDIRDDATKTLITLHRRGEQITRTHEYIANIDRDLGRLLGSLGGMFSKTWKPKKTKAIKGPVITRDDSFKRRGNHLEQREKLGLASVPKGRSNPRKPASKPTTALQKVELDKPDSAEQNVDGEIKSGDYVRVDDINDVQYFYYFVKSENKPTENPLLFWITGGPGCFVLTMGRVDI
ncbi:hypothetical protein IFM89_004153 [Coptis chinensis]|uniref:Uncharacterized protein n=1 Tax=Coptis chinensis TaxID=261450 RepID=A0A835H196_9MAGN|nr:hypothetical protein IFM89_004153 [Coptis chinensis]